MENTKLISLLKSFTLSELKEFQRFIDSPFYNNEKSVSRFFEILKKSAPDFSSKSIQREKIYKKLYPDKSFNDVVLRNIISRTLRLAEDFITLKELDNEDNFKALLKMKALSKREQKFLFDKARQEAEMTIESNPYKNERYFHSKMIYEDEIRKFDRRTKSVSFTKDDNLQKITDNGIYFMTTTLMTLYAVMTNQKKHLVDTNYDFSFMEKLMEYYEANTEFFKGIPYVGLYYNSIKLFLTEEDKYYNAVKKIATENYYDLKEVDRKNAYVVLVNNCSEKINKGELHYLKMKFDLYKEIIDKGAHYEGLNFISHVFYNRVAFTAINIGKEKWALDFINKYRDELTDEHKDNSYALSMTEYYLRKKEFEKALESLSQVQKIDFLYKQEVYALSLKIYYSSGMDESFFSEIDNFRNYLTTNKLVSQRKRELGLNFMSLIKSLHNIKYKKHLGQKYDVFSLRKKILENKYIIDKFWLLEKLAELEEDGRSPIKGKAV